MSPIHPQHPHPRHLQRISCLAILAMLFGVGTAHGDQSPFGPVTGRTNQITTVHHSLSGDTNATVTLNVKLPDTHRVYDSAVSNPGVANGTTEVSIAGMSTGDGPLYQIQAYCNGSWDPICAGVLGIGSCSYASLSLAAKQAIDFLLGPCTGRQCLTVTSLGPGPDVIIRYEWSCAGQATANCVRMSGTLQSSPRIDLLEQDSGCQF